MKLIYAIVPGEDASDVVGKLNENGFQATKISTTGGFLRKKNTTLMIGVEDEHWKKVIGIIKDICQERQTIEVKMPYVNMNGMGTMSYTSLPQKIEVGGAVIFVVNVDYYEKI